MFFTGWYNDDDFEYSKLRLLEQINKVKITLQDNKEALLRIEDSIQQCEDVY